MVSINGLRTMDSIRHPEAADCGRKGGQARAKSLSASERSQVSRLGGLTSRRKLTPQKAKNIRSASESGIDNVTLAKRYRISVNFVGQILRRERYANV